MTKGRTRQAELSVDMWEHPAHRACRRGWRHSSLSELGAAPLGVRGVVRPWVWAWWYGGCR